MNLPVDQIIAGNCIDIIHSLPEQSVDVVFADPPYNLQLTQDLYRPNMTKVDAVTNTWDQFDHFSAYDEFTRQWLSACRHALKDTGTIWVIGSYHNVYRVGKIMMDLEYWTLNDVVWVKHNPTPNFNGTRFTNAHETLIWAQKHKGEHYTFNYHGLKRGNEDKQMRSVWELPICTGVERLMIDGRKAHPTQKPEALLYRVLISSTNAGDVVLDPFFGTGTTGAVAKKLRRRFIGIESEETYVKVARQRIDAIPYPDGDDEVFEPSNKPRLPRVPFVRLLENGLLIPGQKLRFRQTRKHAVVAADGALIYRGKRGSIHQIGRQLTGAPCNGWKLWHYQAEEKDWRPIDNLREELRQSK